MKRPEGFDRREESAGSRPAKASPARVPRPGRAPTPPRSTTPPRSATPSASRAPRERPTREPATARVDPVKEARRRLSTERRDAQRELRRARAERRRYERQEIKRFTVRQRARRAALWTTAGILALVIGLVLVAIFSPILALRQVLVEGTDRVDAAAVEAVVAEQLGTPLALIDMSQIAESLEGFPVIESFATETIPPGTLLVRIVERQPVVTVEAPGGRYLHVDPAGVTVEELTERIPGVPLVTESGTSLPNPAFEVAVEVLRAMPLELRAQVDRITALTRDDVTLWLVGAVQSVEWGSADDSIRKAAVLQRLQAIYGTTPGVFDVSGSETGIFRPL